MPGAGTYDEIRHAGDTDDFHAAINAFLAAVKATPDGHQEHIWLTSSMAGAMLAYYGHTGNPSVLDRAIEGLKAATAATPQ